MRPSKPQARMLPPMRGNVSEQDAWVTVREEAAEAMRYLQTDMAAYSEGAAWRTVQVEMDELRRLVQQSQMDRRLVLASITKTRVIADVMLAQLDRDQHANPRQRNPILVYGNPPGPTLQVRFGDILGYVERLDYERTATPRGLYFHDFGNADALWTASLADKQRVVVIANVNHRPLWGER